MSSMSGSRTLPFLLLVKSARVSAGAGNFDEAPRGPGICAGLVSLSLGRSASLPSEVPAPASSRRVQCNGAPP